MGILKEFKEFAVKGNVVDLAVAVVIGGAFGKIITSLVDDVITPLILSPALEAAGVEDIGALNYNGIAYGNFLSAVISFIFIAFALFMIVKGINKINKKPEEAAAGPTDTEKLLAEIRDELKKK